MLYHLQMTTKSIGALALRRSLQAWLVLYAGVMLWIALSVLIFGSALIEGEEKSASVDNAARFLAGAYLLFPFVILWVIPSIERHAMPIRLVAAAQMCGGIGRLISVLQFGSASDGALISMGLELSWPLVIAWQHAVARQHQSTVNVAGATP